MAGSLQSVARIIHDGDLTLAECAVQLGISRDQLENRLRLMERQGYIRRQGGDAQDTATCSCGHCCASCSRSESRPIPVTYTLTAKGECLLRQSSGC